MLSTARIIMAVIIALGALAAFLTSPQAGSESIRLARAGDVRQEDRGADRREDRRNGDAKEVRVPLPRNADGTVDFAALLASIGARVDAGAREVQIRKDSLTQDEVRALLLTPEGRDVLVRIGALLPNDGRERNVTFRGAVDARVQRQPDGSLRLIVRDIDTGRLTAAERAQLARDLSASSGFDRVRIRGVDADGNRIRVEFRADRGLVRNEGGDGRVRQGQVQQDQREGRHGRDERAERTARNDRGERGDRVERADRSGPSERVERVERTDRSGPSERVERVERAGSGNSGRH